MNKNKIEYALRFGLAFAFIYPAISAFIEPNNWIGFIPIFIRELVPAYMFLFIYSIIEVVIGVGILLSKNPFYYIISGGFILATIVIFNIGSFDLVFRDISIIGMAIALAGLTVKKT
ncbi:MAG: hypothetical protein AAB614_01705 [Patescibacteria group bacterium]